MAFDEQARRAPSLSALWIDTQSPLISMATLFAPSYELLDNLSFYIATAECFC